MLKGRYRFDQSREVSNGLARLVSHWLAPPGADRCGPVQEHPRGEQLFPPRHFWKFRNADLRGRFFAVFVAIFVSGGVFANPPGAVVSNQAALDYVDIAGLTVTNPSNTVQVVTAVLPSVSSIEFTRVLVAGTGDYQETVGPSACYQGGAFATLADPVLTGGNLIDPTQAQEVSIALSYNLGESLFLRLTDSDQNLDYQVLDTAVVSVINDATGDTETIQLTETGLNTGVFAGYVPSARAPGSSGDCVLQGSLNSSVRVTYTDPIDGADTAQTTASLDPVSIVFESRTGTPIDNVQIEIVDAVTGQPALVYGNDGVSIFPSAILSGTAVTDSSGATYPFSNGEYRFPVVPPGDYRLVATPPPAYAAPSTTSIEELQLLAGAPYSLQPESFGAPFTQGDTLSFDVDIPVDPQSTALYLQKRTTTTVAAPGDFIRYELLLENASATGAATDILVVDQLPLGVRFMPGSVKIDGDEAIDPQVSPDLRTLEFSIASIAPNEQSQIYYVVEIVGGRTGDDLVNRATAFAGAGLISNEATAIVRLTEELFRSTGTIIGRVLEADCSQDTFSEEQGVPNIRIYLEDGRYAVTDEGGRYHFEGLKAGTHVAQMDTFTVPEYFDVVGCSDTPGFSGRAASQFVKLSRGSLLRADFYLQRKLAPEGRIDIELRNLEAESADEVTYELKLNGIGNVLIENTKLIVMLPEGVSYLPGTMLLDNARIDDPQVLEGALSLAIEDHQGNWSSELRFLASIDSQVDGEFVTKAIAQFDSALAAGQRTPVVETKMIREPAISKNEGYVLDLKFDVMSATLSAADRLQLNNLIEDWEGVSDIQISAVGHSDSNAVRPRNRHLFENNYVLSQARAMAAAFYLADALKIPTENIQVEGRGPDDPIANNATADGRQKNRRVEMILSGVRPSKPSFLEVTQATSGTKETATKGAIPGMDKKARPGYEEIDPDAGMPISQVIVSAETLQPGVKVLHPEKTFQPAVASTKISVQHKASQIVKAYLNGSSVSQFNFDAMSQNIAKTVAVSTWKGVDLKDGDNEILVVVTNADGTPAKTLRRNLYYSGPPVRGEFVPELSTLVADGKNMPVVAVRLFDRAGRLSRTGTMGTFRVEAPYRSQWDVDKDRKNKLVDIGNNEPVYRVGPDGIAYLELAPTTRTGEAVLNLRFDRLREQEIRTWLKSAARDWILVGFAEGTAGYSTLSDNIDSAVDAGHEDGYVDEGRVAFFAKGQIKGNYLMTLAYDSDRDTAEARNRFQTVVDPNAFYGLYADTSEQRFEASSQRKLYLKIERNQFYALFGDFNTGLTVTDLSRYQRIFNGFKSEFRGEHIGYNVFATETNQAFNRDELRGDGTSGLYQLSTAPIILNSDKVRIEIRDRLDSSVVLSTTNLNRYVDYTLDTLNGTLFFKKPIPSRDLEFNPVYIVAEYESASLATDDLIAGGRASVRTSDNAVEFGLTHVSDDTQGSESDLTGVDLRWQINAQTLLKAEYAGTNKIEENVELEGVASSISIEHTGENVEITAFAREVDNDFGLGYQSAADKGFRRLGVDARSTIGEHFLAEGLASWQQNLETKDIRNLVRAHLRYQRDAFTASLGITHAEDSYEDGETRTSDLAEIGVSQKIFNSKLTLRASGSLEISNDADNTDFPTRYVVGADYQLTKDIDLVAEYEKARGTGFESTMTRFGVRTRPWRRAEASTYLTNQATEFGPRLFANVGLIQGFQINERWTGDIGLDQSNTLVDSEARIFDPDRELVSGSLNEDFLAVHAGAMYSAEVWSANSRLEYRNSDSEERSTLLVGWYREPIVGHGMSAGISYMQSENVSGNDFTRADFKLGWAYRKADSKWSFLDRVDLIFDRAINGAEELESWRVINNFNANRRFSAAMQMSLQYAFKYVSNEFDDDAYSGYTDLIGFDFRRGMRQRWDVGINTSIYHSYNSKVIDYGLGADVGFNVRDNMWLTLGYNITGFYDSDFSQARYTAQGPYLRFSIKADQQTLKSIAGRR